MNDSFWGDFNATMMNSETKGYTRLDAKGAFEGIHLLVDAIVIN
jgi:hypothetical protein